MSLKNFCRNCPECQVKIYYSTRKNCNTANKVNSLCKECARRTLIYKPKEEFICVVCDKKWLEWRSQISNTENPCCSKACWLQHGSKTLVGNRFGKLLVSSRVRRNRTTFYKCKCDCGNHTEVTHTNLISGGTSSCGCLIVETRGSERKPLKEVVSKAILNFYKRNAKNRNIEWLLPNKNFIELINGNCFYCGNNLSNLFTWRYKYEVATLPFNGIDRVDNTIGYTPENCVTSCKRCNQAKNDMTFTEFKTWAIKLANQLTTM